MDEKEIKMAALAQFAKFGVRKTMQDVADAAHISRKPKIMWRIKRP